MYLDLLAFWYVFIKKIMPSNHDIDITIFNSLVTLVFYHNCQFLHQSCIRHVDLLFVLNCANFCNSRVPFPKKPLFSQVEMKLIHGVRFSQR